MVQLRSLNFNAEKEFDYVQLRYTKTQHEEEQGEYVLF